MEALGWQLQQQDFIHIATLSVQPDPRFEQADAWIFTSQHAVKAVAGMLGPVSEGKKVFCLESATLRTLREMLPNVDVQETAPDGAQLANHIITASPESAVFFCGNIRRDAIPEKLKTAGIPLLEVVVYETIPAPAKLSNDANAILFFSPSAVDSFFQENSIPENAFCFAIGATTASAILSINANAQIIVAAQPTQPAMLDALKNHYQTHSFESA